MLLNFSVNGLPVSAQYPDESVEDILIPLLRGLTQMQKALGRRLTVLMAGPPAMGKSTLCCFLETLSRNCKDLTPVQCVGLDGFHYSNTYLLTHTAIVDDVETVLRTIKGAPETFDVQALAELLEKNDPVFPVYDRTLHESVPAAIPITEDILIIEGNWLLLDTPPWVDLSCDFSIFLQPENPDQLLERALNRKIAGGFDPEKARAFVYRSDRRNIQYCIDHSRRADLQLLIRTNGYMEVIK